MPTFNKVNENVAKDSVLNVENASTKIKVEIIKCVNSNISKEETLKRCKLIIAEATINVSDPSQKLEVANSLYGLAQKTYYDFYRAIKLLGLATYKELITKGLIDNPQEFNELLKSGGIQGMNTMFDRMRNKTDINKKAVVPIIEDYNKKVNTVLRGISADAPIVVDKNGKKLSLRNLSEMTVRYKENMEEVARFKQEAETDGTRFVWISSHPNCSPRCSQWQGRLYSLDGTKGTHNGISFVPLEDAMEANGGNGCISGYNCRHELIPYVEGKNIAPQKYTSYEIKKQYAIDQKQRMMEASIRATKKMELLERANGNSEEASKLRVKSQILTKKYEIYSLKNGRSFNRWRCQVSLDERSAELKASAGGA